MKKPLPKYERQSKEVRFTLTERDLEILRAVNRYRYLRTSQIKRLVFPENQSLQSTQRRLKYLYHNRYLGRIAPLVQIGKGGSETAYFLDKAGLKLLEEQGEELYSYAHGNGVKHQFLEHALDLSEFRLHVELALKGHPTVELHRFTCDFEIKGHTQKAIGKKIYKLYDEVVHPLNKERYVVYPDALVILKGKGQYEEFQKLYFVEIDRGTHGLAAIQRKVIGFNLYRREQIFQKFGKFESFVVLFQTNSAKRAENIRKCLTDLEGADLVWITDHTQVRAETVLAGEIWRDAELRMRRILKG